MGAVPGLADGGASLLDADPGLMRVIGRRTAAGFVHRRVLPVLSVVPGSWTPPAAARCGPETFALAVLDGLLTTEHRALKGPGDMIAPWGSDWVACTPVRLAVIGRAYLDAVARWPAMQQRVRSRLTPYVERARRRRRHARRATGGAAVADRSALGQPSGRPGSRSLRRSTHAR